MRAVSRIITRSYATTRAVHNRGVVYVKPGIVDVRDIEDAKLEHPLTKKKIEHGVILRVIATNICGSDQHMVRGRTTAPEGLVLGHEITGEVIETGRDVEFIKKGDVVRSVPYRYTVDQAAPCASHLRRTLPRSPPRVASTEQLAMHVMPVLVCIRESDCAPFAAFPSTSRAAAAPTARLA